MFFNLGPLACSTDSYLSGSSCYKENNKDTWQGAQEGCFKFGGGLVKIDNYDQHQFLIRFLEISGLKKAEVDVSTSYLQQVSPAIKIKRNDMLTHFFLCEE